ncbi:hypothetical protein GF319_00900 [Candidatus Bathyarchaeota archaeon]|nr:hypothetical protein [Candidatus Bathyarchaeota archaeon]
MKVAGIVLSKILGKDYAAKFNEIKIYDNWVRVDVECSTDLTSIPLSTFENKVNTIFKDKSIKKVVTESSDYTFIDTGGIVDVGKFVLYEVKKLSGRFYRFSGTVKTL